MRFSAIVTKVASLLAVLAVAAEPASAACTRLAFSVNDYGKDGPIKDAKKLLDTYVAKWTAERGIKTYRIGKKDVSCELFLDVILFDEHTCKAEATVCWDGPPVPGQTQAATAGEASKPGAASDASGLPKKADSSTQKPSAPRPATASATQTKPTAAIETGAVTGTSAGTIAPTSSQKASPPTDVAAPAKAAVAPVPNAEPASLKAAEQATEQALQAAQRAAAAAERAAAAAERAAAAVEKAPVKAQ